MDKNIQKEIAQTEGSGVFCSTWSWGRRSRSKSF